MKRPKKKKMHPILKQVLRIVREQEAVYLNQMEGAGMPEFAMHDWAAGAMHYLEQRIRAEVKS